MYLLEAYSIRLRIAHLHLGVQLAYEYDYVLIRGELMSCRLLSVGLLRRGGLPAEAAVPRAGARVRPHGARVASRRRAHANRPARQARVARTPRARRPAAHHHLALLPITITSTADADSARQLLERHLRLPQPHHQCPCRCRCQPQRRRREWQLRIASSH